MTANLADLAIARGSLMSRRTPEISGFEVQMGPNGCRITICTATGTYIDERPYRRKTIGLPIVTDHYVHNSPRIVETSARD